MYAPSSSSTFTGFSLQILLKFFLLKILAFYLSISVPLVPDVVMLSDIEPWLSLLLGSSPFFMSSKFSYFNAWTSCSRYISKSSLRGEKKEKKMNSQDQSKLPRFQNLEKNRKTWSVKWNSTSTAIYNRRTGVGCGLRLPKIKSYYIATSLLHKVLIN